LRPSPSRSVEARLRPGKPERSDEAFNLTDRPSLFLHPLPRGAPVDRLQYVVEACRAKRVIHVGFADHPLRDVRVARGDWLHSQISAVADSLVGLDISTEDVEWARNAGFEAMVVDATCDDDVRGLELDPADVVLASEVLEHVDAPGPFVQAMHHLCRPEGRLIITTPNALQPLPSLAALTGTEVIHEDHVTLGYTPKTLTNLLVRRGWALDTFAYYHNPYERLQRGRGVNRATMGVIATIVRWVAGHAPRPYWSDGLIAVARRADR
jgi:SAM-dependent methyltransferase